MEKTNTCPFCNAAELTLVPADEPWHDEYLICPVCCSTYNLFDDLTKVQPSKERLNGTKSN